MCSFDVNFAASVGGIFKSSFVGCFVVLFVGGLVGSMLWGFRAFSCAVLLSVLRLVLVAFSCAVWQVLLQGG